MKYKLLTILLFHCFFSLAQSDKVTVTDVKPPKESKDRPEYEEYHLPKVTYSDKKIEEKINIFLQIEYLEHLPGVFKEHPYEKICYDPNDNQGTVSFEGWEKYKTPKNILSLKIEGEATGAYPEHFEQYRSFDLTTGNPIMMRDLLLDSKTKELAELLNQKVKTEIEDYLKEVRDSLKNPAILGEERERYGEQDTMYSDCLRDHNDSTMDSYEYYFTKDSVTFVLGRCSNHAMRAIDDLYDFYIPMAYTDLETYLNPYGKSIVYSKNTVVIPDGPEEKMFKGSIGKIPVTLIITERYYDSTSIYPMYWYDKHKIPIDLDGTYSSGHFTFKEKDNNNNLIATIEADWVDNRKIIGTWTNAKTGEVLKLALEAY
jgi:hypothetical protein